MRRALAIAATALAVWLVVLVILGFALGGRTGQRVADRLGDSLQATGEVGDADLALVRGAFSIEKLALRRDDGIGHLALTVDDIRCDLPPLGLAVVWRECRELYVRGVRLEVSTLALFDFKRPRPSPFRVHDVVIEDAVLAFSPSALAPGLGRVEIRVVRAEAGATVFKSPLSWIYALRDLRAELSLPAGLAVQLAYRDGKLRASGSLFGSTPVELPFALPVADVADDAAGEMKKLLRAFRDVGEQLIARRAKDWIKSKLP